MFKLVLKYNIVDHCINQIFDKFITNFQIKSNDNNVFIARDLEDHHNGSIIDKVTFTHDGETLTINSSSEIIDTIYLFHAWIPTEGIDWQIHVIHNDGDRFHYLINNDTLVKLAD